MIDERDVMQIILDKLDKIDTRVDSIDVTMARNTASLEEHVKRTNMLESELKPIKEHVAFVQHSAKFVGVMISCVAALTGIAATLIKLFL